ncbi:(Fe-S)-binding protein [Bacillus chungangensis]|uniref:L-lactate dehydrogenase complex protein LldE n=1 Tax=Bacillus chungangensis TaxID=587633 RepID=A0ABT9WNI3_9BACI|nr:(Fe-S)-binding protein [Bacillus chungangensis]MDQ0174708.1 L-lactate dehydrogenase complex protein LldE [Bacillus chungangensis]
MKVSLFATCLVDLFETNVGKAAVVLLERLGCEVSFPSAQTCCGQPAYNSGYVKQSKEAMKRMMEAFEDANYVVAPSGSCAAMFQEYPRIFAGNGNWQKQAEALAKKTYELTQFIVHVLKIENVGASLYGKATVHPSCHMTRLLGVKEEALTLLRNVEGLELIPLPKSYHCCGFGGTFAVKMEHISEQMVEEKAAHVESTNADFLIGADSGCMMNIRGRMERKGTKMKVMHIAEVLISQ